MTIEPRAVDRDGLHLAALVRPDGAEPALVVVPGMSEAAEDYRSLLEGLPGRRAVAVGLRGRGSSHAPSLPGDYSVAAHVGDIAACAGALGAEQTVVAGFSLGAGYAMAWAIGRPAGLAGVVVGDYPPRLRSYPEGWAEEAAATTWRGAPVGERLAPDVLPGIAAASTDRDLLGELAILDLPVLVVTGDREDALLGPEGAQGYSDALADCTVAVLADRGHDLVGDDAGPLADKVEAFLDRVGAAASGRRAHTGSA